MEQQPTSEEKWRASDELIAAAKRGDAIDPALLNPKDTSPETIAYINLIRRRGYLALDIVQITL